MGWGLISADKYREYKSALEANRREDGSINLQQVGATLGRSRSSAQMIARQVKAYEDANGHDPALVAAADAVGTNMVPTLAWVKTKGKDGEPGYSVLLKPDPRGDDFFERITESVNGIKPIKPIREPKATNSDLLTLYPIADAHLGMMAWGKETGSDYNTSIACQRLSGWMQRCIDRAPASETAIILDVGDLLHADDQKNMTPRSGHILDVDTRYYRTLELTIAALAVSIEAAAQKHAKVIVRMLPGNHDPHAYMAVMFALAERYRNNPRIEIQKVPGEFFHYVHGVNMIAAHHGDKGKAQQLVLFMADQWAEQWGKTRHRFLWTGHLHHHKSQDIGGVKWEQLRAMTERDAYAFAHAYTARAQLQAVTYHKEFGEYERAYVGQ